jgi:hypothetical protein
VSATAKTCADVALERLRVNQQLDVDGGAHDLAPAHKALRLFDPAPNQLAGQLFMSTDESTAA